MAAMVLPGAASASEVGEQCSGGPIAGQGASVENVAQGLWTEGFHTSTNKLACAGGKKQGSKETPIVTYKTTSSGTGLKSWGAEGKKEATGFGPTNAFIGTAEAPNSTQQGNIIDNESPITAGTLETLPVAQFALTIYVNLPSGCVATSVAASGRLALTDAELQGIYAGTITTWSGINGGGNTISAAPEETCNLSAPITVVVRGEKAGTTNVLKKYLGLINSEAFPSAGGLTWDQLSEGKNNVTWPITVTPTKVEGDAAEAALVAETPGSIGYSNLAELRETGLFSDSGTAGDGTSKFWVELENSAKTKGSGSKAKTTYTYQDPSTNLDIEPKAAANCKKAVYTVNGTTEGFPTAEGLWNAVTTAVPPSTVKEGSYPLCNFTYVLAFNSYSLLSGGGATLDEATTVNNYLKYVANKTGGQELLGVNDYLAVPKGQVETALNDGVAEIGF
jgi:ABC-type phosphate transport system substrate-binding protein